jgi:hypothetical protein
MHVWLATTPNLIGSEDMYHMVCSVNMQVITESQNLDRWYQLLVGRASARARSTSVTVDSVLPPPPPLSPLTPPLLQYIAFGHVPEFATRPPARRRGCALP